MDTKPIVLTEDHSLVDHDLSNVYAHWLNEKPAAILQHDVKFKKKEQIETLKKSVLKHRIRLLTGKVSFSRQLFFYATCFASCIYTLNDNMKNYFSTLEFSKIT